MYNPNRAGRCCRYEGVHLHSHRLALSGLFIVNLVAFAACTSAPTTGPSTAPQPPGPVQPRVNRVVMAVAPPTLEGASPNRDLGTPQNFQLRPMYEYLISIDAQSGKYLPQLATDWTLEPDGKSWRFHLRKGVPFHGQKSEFTAKDVVYSHQDILPDGSINSNAPFFRNSIEQVEAVNDAEVVVRMKAADADFLNLFGEQIGGVMLESKVDADAGGRPTMQTKPTAGTGPYQFKERAQGSFVRFERVPYKHWRSTPDFPEFEFRWMKEASTRLASLLTGEVHLTAVPQDLEKQALQQGMAVVKGRVPALRVIVGFLCCTFKTAGVPSSGFAHPDSPLMDVRVRQALNRGIDRDQLNKSFFGGKAELMYVNHFHPTRLGWNPDWEKRFPAEFGYDPAKARSLLADAGYTASNPYKINVVPQNIPDVPETPDVFDAIIDYWKKVGVQVTQLTMDPTQYSATGRNLGFDNHATMLVTSSSQLLGFIVYNSTYPGIGSSSNPVDNPDLFALVDKIKKEPDQDKSAAVWRQVGDLSFSLYQSVPLFWLPAEMTVNPKVVADYIFPGSISGTWTHVDMIKAAP